MISEAMHIRLNHCFLLTALASKKDQGIDAQHIPVRAAKESRDRTELTMLMLVLWRGRSWWTMGLAERSMLLFIGGYQKVEGQWEFDSLAAGWRHSTAA